MASLYQNILYFPFVVIIIHEELRTKREREIVIFSFQIHQYLLGNYFLQIES